MALGRNNSYVLLLPGVYVIHTEVMWSCVLEKLKLVVV